MDKVERQVYVFTCTECKRPHIAYVRVVEMSCCKKRIQTFKVMGAKQAEKLSKLYDKGATKKSRVGKNK